MSSILIRPGGGGPRGGLLGLIGLLILGGGLLARMGLLPPRGGPLKPGPGPGPGRPLFLARSSSIRLLSRSSSVRLLSPSRCSLRFVSSSSALFAVSSLSLLACSAFCVSRAFSASSSRSSLASASASDFSTSSAFRFSLAKAARRAAASSVGAADAAGFGDTAREKGRDVSGADRPEGMPLLSPMVGVEAALSFALVPHLLFATGAVFGPRTGPGEGRFCA